MRWCVYLCCCSANERLGVSGFQVPVLWERRWVTGLMNSDGRQLLINQETVCQPADWNISASPMCTHTLAHKHTQAWKYIHMCTRPCRSAHNQRICTYTEFISPSSGSPALSVERRPILPFPPTAWVEYAYYLCAHTSPSGASFSLNMETPANCKFWMRPRVQKVQKIKAKTVTREAMIFTF